MPQSPTSCWAIEELRAHVQMRGAGTMVLTSLPPRVRRRFAFMLVPLVDIMFLLLIFFMLSSQTSLYSLLRISAVAGGESAAGPAAAAPEPEIVVAIGKGQVRLNGTRLLLADLPQAVEQYKALGITRAALLATDLAQVQDLVSVLEIFEAGQFGEVRLVSQSGGAL